MWSGAIGSIPVGWLLCDGTASAPDLSGKFVIGIDVGGDADFDTMGETGGVKEVTLTEAQIPAHSHSHSNKVFDVGGTVTDVTGTILSTGQKETEETGGGTAHSNMPPFYTLAYIIKTPVT
jgi:microcystin-dependent protein